MCAGCLHNNNIAESNIVSNCPQDKVSFRRVGSDKNFYAALQDAVL